MFTKPAVGGQTDQPLAERITLYSWQEVADGLDRQARRGRLRRHVHRVLAWVNPFALNS